ncbi:MAG: ABC-2 family transporter protein [bacterium]|nr:ABC-2 family transporter protein [bacterium]
MKKYLKIFQNRLAVGLEYRSNIVSSLILDLFSLSSILLLWFAVYREHHEISGFTFSEAILYYSLVLFVGSFTYVPISDELGYEIREGALSSYLLKPFKISIDAFCRAVASKINYVFVTFPVYFIIMCVFAYYFGPIRSITLTSLMIGICMTLVGFFLHFLLDLVFTWSAFWIGDVWTFKHFKNIVFLVFGGIIFPLEFVSGWLRILFEILPFKYMYYIPVSYILSKRGTEHIIPDLMGAVLWGGVFIIVSNILWNRGLKKFEAYGG